MGNSRKEKDHGDTEGTESVGWALPTFCFQSQFVLGGQCPPLLAWWAVPTLLSRRRGVARRLFGGFVISLNFEVGCCVGWGKRRWPLGMSQLDWQDACPSYGRLFEVTAFRIWAAPNGFIRLIGRSRFVVDSARRGATGRRVGVIERAARAVTVALERS